MALSMEPVRVQPELEVEPSYEIRPLHSTLYEERDLYQIYVNGQPRFTPDLREALQHRIASALATNEI